MFYWYLLSNAIRKQTAKKALHQYLFHVCVILEEVKSLLGQDMLLQKTLNLCYSWISNVWPVGKPFNQNIN